MKLFGAKCSYWNVCVVHILMHTKLVTQEWLFTCVYYSSEKNRENQRGNQEWAIQRHWQHWAQKTQDEDIQSNNKKNNTTRKTNLTRWATRTPPKSDCGPRCLWNVSSSCYKTLTMLLSLYIVMFDKSLDRENILYNIKKGLRLN